MKTILLAAAAAIGVALAAPAFAAVHINHTVSGGNYRPAATDSEGQGGSNPYAAPMLGQPKTEPAEALLTA